MQIVISSFEFSIFHAFVFICICECFLNLPARIVNEDYFLFEQVLVFMLIFFAGQS